MTIVNDVMYNSFEEQRVSYEADWPRLLYDVPIGTAVLSWCTFLSNWGYDIIMVQVCLRGGEGDFLCLWEVGKHELTSHTLYVPFLPDLTVPPSWVTSLLLHSCRYTLLFLVKH